MRQYKSLENIIENLDTKKYQVPEDWPYKEARRLFLEPEITDPETIDVIFYFIIPNHEKSPKKQLRLILFNELK